MSQAPNDKQAMVPALKKITELPEELGVAEHLLGDTGFFSAANVAACEKAGIRECVKMLSAVFSKARPL